jgi:hypothetical protein
MTRSKLISINRKDTMTKTAIKYSLLAAALVCVLAANTLLAQTATPPTPEQAKEELAYTIGTQACEPVSMRGGGSGCPVPLARPARMSCEPSLVAAGIVMGLCAGEVSARSSGRSARSSTRSPGETSSPQATAAVLLVLRFEYVIGSVHSTSKISSFSSLPLKSISPREEQIKLESFWIPR